MELLNKFKNKNKLKAVGSISGTSLDGIDVALLENTKLLILDINN